MLTLVDTAVGREDLTTLVPARGGLAENKKTAEILAPLPSGA
jgi:hypothetical protein